MLVQKMHGEYGENSISHEGGRNERKLAGLPKNMYYGAIVFSGQWRKLLRSGEKYFVREGRECLPFCQDSALTLPRIICIHTGQASGNKEKKDKKKSG
jgi:hypothetical protein